MKKFATASFSMRTYEKKDRAKTGGSAPTLGAVKRNQSLENITYIQDFVKQRQTVNRQAPSNSGMIIGSAKRLCPPPPDVIGRRGKSLDRKLPTTWICKYLSCRMQMECVKLTFIRSITKKKTSRGFSAKGEEYN